MRYCGPLCGSAARFVLHRPAARPWDPLDASAARCTPLRLLRALVARYPFRRYCGKITLMRPDEWSAACFCGILGASLVCVVHVLDRTLAALFPLL